MKDKNEKINKEENEKTGDNEELKALPESFEAEAEPFHASEKEPKGTAYFPFRFGAALVAVAIFQAVAIALLFALFVMSPASESEPSSTEETEWELPSDTVPAENWRGVFDSEETYRSCLGSLVLIEGGNGAIVQTGFVYSSEGYIATVLPRETVTEGRLYVTDSHGEKHKVDSIVQDGDSGISLLKISAKGLRAVDFYSEHEELLPGEELIALGCYSTSEHRIRTGEASGVREAMLDVNISLGASACGTPLFDREGRLAAVVCEQKEESEYITAAILASDFEKTLSRLKSDNY